MRWINSSTCVLHNGRVGHRCNLCESLLSILVRERTLSHSISGSSYETVSSWSPWDVKDGNKQRTPRTRRRTPARLNNHEQLWVNNYYGDFQGKESFFQLKISNFGWSEGRATLEKVSFRHFLRDSEGDMAVVRINSIKINRVLLG